MSRVVYWLGIISLCLACAAQAQASDCTATTNIMQVQVAQGSDSQPYEPWLNIELPHNWQQLWPAYEGSVWYKIEWQRGCGAQALMIDSIILAGELYVNEQLFWFDRNRVEPLSRSWAIARYWLLPEALLNNDKNTLLIRTVGHLNEHGGLGVVQLGSAERIYPIYLNHIAQARTITQVNFVVTAVLGCLAFLLWLTYPRQRLYAWYALVSVSWLGMLYFMLATETKPFSDSLAFSIANTCVYILYVFSFCFFTWRLLNLKVPAWVIVGFYVFLSLGISYLLLWPSWSANRTMGDISSLIILFSNLVVIGLALKHRTVEHSIVAIVLLITVVIAVRDVMALLQLIDSRMFFTNYTSILYLIMAALLLGRRAAANARKVEKFNQEIEMAVNKACYDLTTLLNHEHSQQLSHIKQHERTRIAHDLHDGVGGQIIRSIISVEKNASQLSQQHFLSMLKQLRDDLRQVIDTNVSIDDLQVQTFSQWLAPIRYRFDTLFDELGIDTLWAMPSDELVPFSKQPLLVLTRIIEEALTNIIKHSQATEMSVELIRAHSQLQLIISDNGRGFNMELLKQNGGGVGLHSMQDRVKSLNGQFDIAASTYARGVAINIILPINEQTI